ncbi:unnamed protein product [Cuscuta europaea]|uniref:Uncharacterized protein n=1 Tax=Cuscuta europaea TaxID=41803 RepID=A0A9P1E147_CUSEU|nr:unnamed protein product [Cuscuta europaea]
MGKKRGDPSRQVSTLPGHPATPSHSQPQFANNLVSEPSRFMAPPQGDLATMMEFMEAMTARITAIEGQIAALSLAVHKWNSKSIETHEEQADNSLISHSTSNPWKPQYVKMEFPVFDVTYNMVGLGSGHPARGPARPVDRPGPLLCRTGTGPVLGSGSGSGLGPEGRVGPGSGLKFGEPAGSGPGPGQIDFF